MLFKMTNKKIKGGGKEKEDLNNNNSIKEYKGGMKWNYKKNGGEGQKKVDGF